VPRLRRYCTTSVTVVVREAVPEVAETVTVYVPAGVPPEGGLVVFAVVPHPGNHSAKASTAPNKIPPSNLSFLEPLWPDLLIEDLLLIPKLSNANPETGSQVP